MLARFPRFPAHPPVGLTQRMSQHNIKAPLKKRPMVAPTGMVGTQIYSVGASIARPPSCGLTGKANRLHTQPPLRSYDLRQKPRHDGRPMVAPTGMVGTRNYNVGRALLARLPRFPTHPPVGLTQRMSQHNIKAPLKKRPMVAPTGMVRTKIYSVGASIARPFPPVSCAPSCRADATDVSAQYKSASEKTTNGRPYGHGRNTKL